MPVSGHAMLLYQGEVSRSFRRINLLFEHAREELEALYRVEEPSTVMTEREAEQLFAEYRRLRGWLYGLLPEWEG